MDETARTHLIDNLVGSLKGARKEIQERQVKLFFKIDPQYGGGIAKAIGLPVEQAKL